MAVMWGSSVGGLIDGEGSTPEIEAATKPANALTVGGSSVSLWWDGLLLLKIYLMKMQVHL